MFAIGTAEILLSNDDRKWKVLQAIQTIVFSVGAKNLKWISWITVLVCDLTQHKSHLGEDQKVHSTVLLLKSSENPNCELWLFYSTVFSEKKKKNNKLGWTGLINKPFQRENV